MICPPVREIIHSLKLLDYLPVQADKPWYNYYIILLVQADKPLYNYYIILGIYSVTVTHVITSCNTEGRCARTIKYLQAVLTGKWIVSMDCKLWNDVNHFMVINIPESTLKCLSIGTPKNHHFPFVSNGK